MEIELLEPDYYYHIYNRGINRQRIFTTEEHYYKFLELCYKYLPGIADVYAYCLMPNHFHFLLYIRLHPANESSPCLGISHLCNSYAQWFNKKTDRTGSLFQRPFKRKRITEQEYLKRLIYYIHRNPLHHNLNLHPSEYPYSSYQGILGKQKTLLQREQVLDWFDGTDNFVYFHTMSFTIDSESQRR
jgi:REP element-mobilizing transposase RayT